MKRSSNRIPQRRAAPTENSDIVYTPAWVVDDMVDHFAPTGRILEPCKGDGAFLRRLPDAEWCEIQQGRDFLEWQGYVDWIITNPPYSRFAAFLRHSMEVASNIVFLCPLAKTFYSASLVTKVYEWGGIREIRMYGTGSRLGFPFGYAIAAIHFAKSYGGETIWTFQISTAP